METETTTTAAVPRKLWFVRHRDDSGFDRVDLNCADGSAIRIETRFRYKTSGMSGDEWRTSAMIQLRRLEGAEFTDFDGSYRDLNTAAQALYPGLFGHPELNHLSCTHIDFFKKGVQVYRAMYDGKAIPLLAAAGHLPWGIIKAEEDAAGSWPKTEDFCFQAGCSEPPVVTYGLKKQFCREGHETPGEREFFGLCARKFCARHAKRGDCGLEDADDNYFVVDGAVPQNAGPQGQDISESVFGGVIGPWA